MLLGFFFLLFSPPLFNLRTALNEPTISVANTETFVQNFPSMQLISKTGNYEDIPPHFESVKSTWWNTWML